MYDSILTDFARLPGDKSDSERIQRAIDATENGILSQEIAELREMGDVRAVESDKMLESNPVARPHTLPEFKIAKSNLNAKHGLVLKQDVVGNHRDQQQV